MALEWKETVLIFALQRQTCENSSQHYQNMIWVCVMGIMVQLETKQINSLTQLLIISANIPSVVVVWWSDPLCSTNSYVHKTDQKHVCVWKLFDKLKNSTTGRYC